MMADKRDECGCHRECTTLPHECARPCRWPECLTESEHQQLAAELEEDDLPWLDRQHEAVVAVLARNEIMVEETWLLATELVAALRPNNIERSAPVADIGMNEPWMDEQVLRQAAYDPNEHEDVGDAVAMTLDDAVALLLDIPEGTSVQDTEEAAYLVVAELKRLRAMEQRARRHVDGMNMTTTAVLAKHILGE